jgi:Calcineurin-like phosphoesterase
MRDQIMPSGKARVAATILGALAAIGLPLADAGAVTLTRGPYLQLLTTNSVAIVWNTDTAAACSLAIRPLSGTSTILSGGGGTVCAISVTGLTPGVQYGYTPRADGAALGSESIFQADDATAPYTFLVVGDTGDGGSAQLAVRDRMLATPADMILHTGDMIYDSGAAADFDPKFFTPYKNLVRGLVFWPCLGNHDWGTSSGQPWRDAFATPANNPAGSENYYSFDFGNAHFTVLNSNQSTSPGSAQYNFLDQDLAATGQRWKFVAFHHPIYSSSKHGSSTGIRANLVPLFDKNHVDIVFMGHDHDYERTKPLVGSAVVGPNAGTVYITTGGGGKDLYAAGTSFFTAYSESVHHFTRVAVDGDSLVEQMIRTDGVVRDQMTLVKGATSTTTTTIPPVGLDLPAMADTYIEAGAEAAWDHGKADHLDVDTQPFGIIYLKFDLRALSMPVGNATLTLFCSNPTPDGGTIHPVADSSWVEGTSKGSDSSAAGGPGLKWADVDTNHDGMVDQSDTSPFVPDLAHPVTTLGTVVAGQSYTVDVTAAFQSGPGLYTLAIKNGNTNGASYSSNDHATAAQRPRLHLSAEAATCRNLDGPPNDFASGSLRLGHLGSPSGTLKLNGKFPIPTPFSPKLDLIGNGMRLAIQDRLGTVIASAVIPGGDFDGTRGWKVNGVGARWTFRDRGRPALHNGIAKVTIIDESARTPGLISVAVRGRKGTYAARPGMEPLHAVVELNNAAGGGTASQCGEATFAVEQCTFGRSGTTLRCR